MKNEEEDGGVFTLVWTCTGRRYIYDTDSAIYAHLVAARLAEAGREDVQVIGPRTIPQPEGVLAQIRERVEQRYRQQQDLEKLRALVNQ